MLGYVYTIPDSLCAGKKTISDRPSVHKGIANLGAIFTTERRCATSILKVNRHVSDRFRTTLWHSVNRFLSAAEVNNSEGGLDSTIIFVLISAIPNAVFSLQLCIMNLTDLNHQKSLKLKDANASIGRKKSCCHSLLSCR